MDVWTRVAKPSTQDLVVNGDFDTPTDWTLGTGWAYGTNKITFTPGIPTIALQLISFTEGSNYTLTCAVSGTAGSLQIGFIDGSSGLHTQTILAGTGTVEFTALSEPNFLAVIFFPSSNFNGSVSNVRVTLQQWTAIPKPTESSILVSVTDAQPFGLLIAITSVMTLTTSSVTTGWTGISKPTSSVWTFVAKPTQ